MGKAKILCVDDELDMRVYLNALFSTSGYQPIVAKNGQEGLRQARRQNPDLIILDVMMPEAGGVQLYRELKSDKQLRHIPVVMLTGVGEKSFSHYLKMLTAAGGAAVAQPDAYMQKPLDHHKLLALVGQLLA